MKYKFGLLYPYKITFGISDFIYLETPRQRKMANDVKLMCNSLKSSLNPHMDILIQNSSALILL